MNFSRLLDIFVGNEAASQLSLLIKLKFCAYFKDFLTTSDNIQTLFWRKDDIFYALSMVGLILKISLKLLVSIAFNARNHFLSFKM